MTETINLKVDRSLLDPHFETYYLDNPSVSLQLIDLPNSVNEFNLNEKQLYSFLHFSAFSADFNHIFTDPFDGHCPVCYYVDNQLSITKVSIDPTEHSIILPVCVFNLPFPLLKPIDCLVSISFPSKFIVLILITRCSSVDRTDGNSFLLVVSTGDRQNQSSEWTMIKSFDLGDVSSNWRNGDREAKRLNCPTKLIDSHFQSKDEGDELMVNLLSVVKNTDEKFECLVSCIQLIKVQQPEDSKVSWTIKRLQQLSGSSYPSYIASDIDKESELFLTIASVNPFRLTFDSSEKLSDPDGQVESSTEKENLYIYWQDGSEITIQFKLPRDTERNHIQINFGLDEMEIYVRSERVFKEKFWDQVEKDSCTWTLDRTSNDGNSVLEVTLMKKDEYLVWNQLIKGKEQGTHLDSTEVSIPFRQLNSLISGFSDQMNSIESVPGYIPSVVGNEECDETSEDLVLYRFNCHQNSVTHQAYLAGHQWLFHRKVDNHSLPCFSLRHDIDALIWQPQAQGSRFYVQHIATFPALGYVQASKESKKLFNCSPDFEYSFIADSSNHIYIYKQPTRCEGVINRKAGVRPKIAKQKVINLGSELIQILGAGAFKNFLLILGPRKLIYVQIDF